MVLLGKIMILQGVGHPISCLGVCYANDPKKGGYMTPAPALDLTTSLRGDFVFLRLRRQHPFLHKTKGPTRNPMSPTPPPPASFGGRPCHPPPPAEQFSGRPVPLGGCTHDTTNVAAAPVVACNTRWLNTVCCHGMRRQWRFTCQAEFSSVLLFSSLFIENFFVLIILMNRPL